MSSNKFSYPHPILGNYDDIMPVLKGDCVVAEHTQDDDFHYYRFVMSVEDATILELISNDKAKYAVHYKCKDTRHEGCESGKDNSLIIKIPRKVAIGRVDFYLYVIATESFIYTPASAHPIFRGYSFDIHTNDPLVFFPKHWDNLDITHQTIKHYSSILVPVPDENVKGDDVLIKNDEKIEVHISKEAYEKLKVANKPENATDIISSYVQTALLTALFQLFCESDEISEIFQNDKAWVKAVLKRMREPNMPTVEDVYDDPFGEIPSLVQLLLQYPLGALLTKLINNVDMEDGDEII